jgi:CheY-like chemotaxis protein
MQAPLKALVVDDEPDVQWLFQQRFRKELRQGLLQLRFAFSGEEALSYLRTGGAADVILALSDINMPGMTGIELLRRIKREHPDLKVHMITAYGDERNYQMAMAYGADGYVTKPIDFEMLKKEIFGL